MSITPSPMLGQGLRAAGYAYSLWGWTSQPLIADSNGFPKRPFVRGWQNLRLPWDEHLYDLPWEQGIGLGLVLGPASGSLAVIDLDDEALATAAFSICAPKTRCIRTIRRHGHVYLTEETPSQSTAFEVEWQGQKVNVELKATGVQVTAPPTLGYEHVGDRDQKPMVVPSIRFAWDALAARLGITQSAPANAGYPRAWQATVDAGDRNKALYIEAHRLREAKMPLEQALNILQVRWEQSYAPGGQSWQEVEATIRSAYRKALWPGLEGKRNELDLLG